ncbi:hypothetical protein TGPRC2_289270B, partial [Toxoplasma gondii TgCatPRC2]
LRRDNGPQV